MLDSSDPRLNFGPNHALHLSAVQRLLVKASIRLSLDIPHLQDTYLEQMQLVALQRCNLSTDDCINNKQPL